MTISATSYAPAVLNWTGIETSFPAGFQARDRADVSVVSRVDTIDTALTHGVEITIALDASGVVTVTPVAMPDTPATVIISRSTPKNQSVDFSAAPVFSGEVHEQVADIAALRDAEAAYRLGVVEAALGDAVDDAAAAVAGLDAHEAGADPHPQYATPAEAAAAAPVQSVAGRTGAVTLAKSDVGLGNVDNTADASKPISTATQTALDAKAAKALTVAAAGLLTGGGDLSADITLTLTAASQAEAEAGTNNTKGMTPLRTAQAIAALATGGGGGGGAASWATLIGTPDIVTAIAALTAAADKMVYFTGGDTAALATVTSFARSLLDDADAAGARATLGAITSAEAQSLINAVIGAAPGAMDTLAELATALGNDPNFATTVTNALAAKVPTSRTVSTSGLVSGGGDLSADRTLTVTVASQAEAEAGTVSNKAMTPERTAQAIAALGGESATARRNSLLNATYLSGLQSAPLDLIDRWADGFTSSAGIVSGSSSNYAVTTTSGGSVAPTAVAGGNQITTHTSATSASGTVAASTYVAGYEAWRACDGVNNSDASGAYFANGVTGTWTYTFNTAKVITSVDITPPLHATGAARSIKNGLIEGTTNGSTWFTLYTFTNDTGWTNGVLRSFSFSNTSALLGVRLTCTQNNGDGSNWGLGEVALKISGSTNNMTLVEGSGLSAEAAPATIRALLDVTPVDTITLGTDLTVEVSRDGGTTWTAAGAYTTVRTLGSRKIVETDAVSVTGQPSGTSVRARIKTLNNKNLSVGGVTLAWS